jgi:16S rRNA (guanine527-N7)-methyltransferase
MKEFIKEKFLKYGYELNDEQAEKFEKYMNYLLSENEKFNLTAITDKKEIVIKHFIDSILPANEIKAGAKIIDIGTGAGFPAIPLKILRDDLNVTLVDSLQKRVKFLDEVTNLLNLQNVIAVHSRAEDYASKEREKFDYVVSRAVASVPTLAEYLVPFAKLNGKILMYKGSGAEEELLTGKKAILSMGGAIEKTLNFSLDEVESERKIIIIKKIAHTDKKYPRGKNLPKTKPII